MPPMLTSSSVEISRRVWRCRSCPSALPFDPAGFTYSDAGNAVYAWQNYCDFAAGENPVLDQAIMRLDLDLSP